LRRAAMRREPKLVRILLVPGKPGLLAKYANFEVVLIARRDLARPEHAASAAPIAEQHLTVVVERAPVHEGRKLRAHGLELEPRDERREVLGVRADVAHAPACAR